MAAKGGSDEAPPRLGAAPLHTVLTRTGQRRSSDVLHPAEPALAARPLPTWRGVGTAPSCSQCCVMISARSLFSVRRWMERSSEWMAHRSPTASTGNSASGSSRRAASAAAQEARHAPAQTRSRQPRAAVQAATQRLPTVPRGASKPATSPRGPSSTNERPLHALLRRRLAPFPPARPPRPPTGAHHKPRLARAPELRHR